MANLVELVPYVDDGFLRLQDAAQVDRRAAQHEIAGSRVDRLLELFDLLRAVFHAAMGENIMHIVAVSLDAKDLGLVEITAVKRQAEFPYIPTYLAYREFPGIEAAVRRLKQRPDVLLVDGHGRLHPALFGVACYVGVRLDLSTIGVAKHPLVGRVRPGTRSHSGASPIEFRGQVRGYAWTPPGRARPIYVSIGHRISIERALEVVRSSTLRGYPEPLRLADRIGRAMKRNKE